MKVKLPQRESLLAGASVFAAALAVLLPGLWPLVPAVAMFGSGWFLRRASGEVGDVVLASYGVGTVAVALAVFDGLLWPAPPAIGLVVVGVWWWTRGERSQPRWFGQRVHDRTSIYLAVAVTPITAVALLVG